ncbi:class I SAM-dependent methyltransferase [Dactylosporangium matsuzakiense]|uniref:SAM-dependent methyltransferase n=1 Tax=Dactylosporangium matsuzakiense TaxID=53360 RepID=A0A9W6KD15_9ACTN|nr:class I SAM-dependent methyltransferase [Dactylosporangium matsuzakiense]GLK99212.1 SAM-dependent methyltransferase [Dactylosporangium matsuzakiense]
MSAPPPPTDAIARGNRQTWDSWSDGYQRKHGGPLSSEAEAWGLWRRPEAQLRVLDAVAGRDVLELGCGAAHWARSLARRGGRVVALDISLAQLRHAARAAAPQAGQPALVQADAHALPFADASFDVAFSDYGGMSWADPYRTVPELARVLRPGGQLAYCTNSPLFAMCWDQETRSLSTQLRRSYFGLHTRQVAPDAVDFVLGYGEWVRLLGQHGLVVERLIEEPPDPDAGTTFADRPAEWTSRWPIDAIWSVRKRH